MSIDLEVWVKPVREGHVEERYEVCRATFNYVAIDENGKPKPVIQ